jgi:hypothetical protein
MQGGLDMRWNVLACLGASVLGILGSGPRAVAQDVPLVRHHFAGMARITSLPDMEVMRGILALPETRRLRGEAERKLALHLPAWFGTSTSGAAAHGPALVPLIQAALQQESYLEVMGTESGVGSWAVAVRMEEGPATEVGKSLRDVLTPLLDGPAGGLGIVGNRQAHPRGTLRAVEGLDVGGKRQGGL